MVSPISDLDICSGLFIKHRDTTNGKVDSVIDYIIVYRNYKQWKFSLSFIKKLQSPNPENVVFSTSMCLSLPTSVILYLHMSFSIAMCCFLPPHFVFYLHLSFSTSMCRFLPPCVGWMTVRRMVAYHSAMSIFRYALTKSRRNSTSQNVSSISHLRICLLIQISTTRWQHLVY